MKLNEIPKVKGRLKRPKRVGRGIGSGKGKRCGKGMKGQSSRSGGVKGPQFEGGQMPIFRRLPALKGFKRKPNVVYAIINLSQIEKLPEEIDEVNAEILFEHNLIRKPDMKIKLLARGALTRKFTVKVHAASAKAKEMVTAAGGNLEVQA
jgi:large subunit ribosomal protein L15